MSLLPDAMNSGRSGFGDATAQKWFMIWAAMPSANSIVKGCARHREPRILLAFWKSGNEEQMVSRKSLDDNQHDRVEPVCMEPFIPKPAGPLNPKIVSIL